MENRSLTPLEKLQEWYSQNCNGDWEHLYGITIENIDNPGWSVKINLAETGLEEVDFPEAKTQRENENDWYYCQKKGSDFLGAGGPFNLTEIVTIFLDWAENN